MTTWLNVKNNAESALASATTAAATSLTLITGDGAKFPASNFNISIDDEILKCSSRSGDVLTVTRAQEGTVAAAHVAGAIVALNVTAGIITQLQEAVDLGGGGIVEMDDTPGGTDGEITKPPTSNALFDGLANHAAAVKGVHGVGSDYICGAKSSGVKARDFVKGWTSGKVLKGAGADTNPTEETVNISAAVNKTANQSIPHATTATITFDNEEWDTDNIHDNTTNNGRLTCKTAGRYFIFALLAFDDNALGDRIASVKKNGITELMLFCLGKDDFGRWRAAMTTVADLAVNDYIDLQAYQSSGIALNVTIDTRFGMMRMPF